LPVAAVGSRRHGAVVAAHTRRVAPPMAEAQRAGRDWRASSTVDTSQDRAMQMTLAIGPLVALIAGILILVVPRLLNFIVAIYLIIIGLLGLFGGHLNLH
jgi:hypothetical protein